MSADLFTKHFVDQVKWRHATLLIGMLDGQTCSRLLQNTSVGASRETSKQSKTKCKQTSGKQAKQNNVHRSVPALSHQSDLANQDIHANFGSHIMF